MSGRSSLFLIISAMGLLLLGVAGRGAPIALMAILVGGVGVAGLITSSLRRPQLPLDSNLLEDRLQQMEKRLQLTEDELTASNRELSSLKEEREFDRELLERRARAIPPGGPEEGGQHGRDGQESDRGPR